MAVQELLCSPQETSSRLMKRPWGKYSHQKGPVLGRHGLALGPLSGSVLTRV